MLRRDAARVYKSKRLILKIRTIRKIEQLNHSVKPRMHTMQSNFALNARAFDPWTSTG